MVVRSAGSKSRSLVIVLSSIALALCCADLLGWWGHIRILTSMVPNYATMKPNTAVCLGLLGWPRLAGCGVSRGGGVGWR